MTRGLGQLQSTALAYAQMRGLSTVRTGDLVLALRITAKQERELLSRMARGGWITNVRRGLYLFPAQLPLGGSWAPDETTTINAVVADTKARYQITGPSAFNRYGFDEQIPSRIAIYNNALSAERIVGQVQLTWIKVGNDRLGGIERVRMPDGQTLVYSSRVRTLLDAVHDWSRFDSLPRAYGWIRRDVASGRVILSDLADTALRYGNLGTLRRIGVILEQLRAPDRILNRIQRVLPDSTAKIPLIPGCPTRGKFVKRWGVVDNA